MYVFWESYGGYPTLLNKLLQTPEPVTCPTENDVINTVDDNKKNGSHIIVKPETNFQENSDLFPKYDLENFLLKICQKNKFFGSKCNQFISNVRKQVH